MTKRLAIAAFALVATAFAVYPATAQNYDPFHNQIVAGARFHRDFSITASGTSTPLPLQNAGICVVSITSAPTSGTLTVLGASNNVPTFGTLTGFGTAGTITNPTVNTMYPGPTVSPNNGAVALSSIEVSFSGAGTAVGSIDCGNAGSGNAIAIPTPLPVSGSCIPGTSGTTPAGNCFTSTLHQKPPAGWGAEDPFSFGPAQGYALGSGSPTGCTNLFTGVGRLAQFTNVQGVAVNAVVTAYDDSAGTCAAATKVWTFNAATWLSQPVNWPLLNGLSVTISTTLPDAIDVRVGANHY